MNLIVSFIFSVHRLFHLGTVKNMVDFADYIPNSINLYLYWTIRLKLVTNSKYG